MSSLVISGDTSGSVTLEAPAVAGTTTLTLPSTSGTVITTASTPSFSGAVTAPGFIPNSSTVVSNGLFLPTTNTLGFSTNSTERMRLDSSGNLGLGVTPSAWSSPYKVITQGNSGEYSSIWGSSNGDGGANSYGQAGLANNITQGSKYAGNGAASYYLQSGGRHTWYNAASGTAGNAITFTQAMTLTSGGNLRLNTTSAAGGRNFALDVVGFDNTYTAAIGMTSGSTSRLNFYDGTTSSFPSIGSTGDSLVLATSATERARIDSSGNFLIGTNSSDISGGGTTTKISANSGTGYAATNVNTGTAAYSVYQLGSSINANKGGVALFGSGYTSSGLYRQDGMYLYCNGTGGITIAVENTQPIYFATNTTERARIDSSGNLLVGTTSAASASAHNIWTGTASVTTLYIRNTNASTPNGIVVNYSAAAPNGTANEFLYCIDTGANPRASIRSNGGIANYSANNVNLSDERTKTDIQDAGGYLTKICAIPVRTFKYKDQTDDLLNLGVIAQEVEKVAPELVDTTGFGETPEDGVPLKAIYQTDFQYALMKCIQEQQAIIQQLQADVLALKGTQP